MACRASATLWLAVAFFQMALCQDVGRKELQCYRCGFDKPCLERIVTCKEGESCGTIKGDLDYKVHDSIFKKDCISTQKCDREDKISYWGRPYRAIYKCCNSDLCNNETSEVSHSSVTRLPLLLLATTVLPILLAFLS